MLNVFKDENNRRTILTLNREKGFDDISAKIINAAHLDENMGVKTEKILNMWLGLSKR